MTPRRIEFTVIGVPQPQGSARAFIRGNHAIVTHDNPQTTNWRHTIATQAQSVARNELFLGPVALRVTFRLPRPISLPKKVSHHVRKPDLDKLIRAIGDGLTGTVFVDDKQIVELHAAKVYTSGARPPSAHIVVETASAFDQADFLADVVER